MSSRFSLKRVLIPVLIALVAGGGYYAYVVNSETNITPVDSATSLRQFAKRLRVQETMASPYVDRDGDLLADPPTDKFLNPKELSFSVVAGDDPAEAEKTWKPLMDHLAKATGLPVSYRRTVPNASGTTDDSGKLLDSEELRTTEQQVTALRDGLLHVTAFNTGAVPLAVNAAGFHPLFTPADDAGKFDYSMQIIVPGTSTVTSPGELKGQTIAFVALSSNSGARAPLVLLKEKFDLLPGRDYHYVFTGRHERSIEELTSGKIEPNFQAACVASDILSQMVENQKVMPNRVKVIFTSASFPKISFGVPHNLDPPLRAKIVSAFESFRFAGTPLAKTFAAEKRTRFAPIRYSQAFADVLAIDQKLIALFDGGSGNP